MDRFLKVLANAGSYGIFAELNPQTAEHEEGDQVLVYGRNGAFQCRTRVRTTERQQTASTGVSPLFVSKRCSDRVALAGNRPVRPRIHERPA